MKIFALNSKQRQYSPISRQKGSFGMNHQRFVNEAYRASDQFARNMSDTTKRTAFIMHINESTLRNQDNRQVALEAIEAFQNVLAKKNENEQQYKALSNLMRKTPYHSLDNLARKLMGNNSYYKVQEESKLLQDGKKVFYQTTFMTYYDNHRFTLKAEKPSSNEPANLFLEYDHNNNNPRHYSIEIDPILLFKTSFNLHDFSDNLVKTINGNCAKISFDNFFDQRKAMEDNINAFITIFSNRDTIKNKSGILDFETGERFEYKKLGNEHILYEYDKDGNFLNQIEYDDKTKKEKITIYDEDTNLEKYIYAIGDGRETFTKKAKNGDVLFSYNSNDILNLKEFLNLYDVNIG